MAVVYNSWTKQFWTDFSVSFCCFRNQIISWIHMALLLSAYTKHITINDGITPVSVLIIWIKNNNGCNFRLFSVVVTNLYASINSTGTVKHNKLPLFWKTLWRIFDASSYFCYFIFRGLSTNSVGTLLSLVRYLGVQARTAWLQTKWWTLTMIVFRIQEVMCHINGQKCSALFLCFV